MRPLLNKDFTRLPFYSSTAQNEHNDFLQKLQILIQKNKNKKNTHTYIELDKTMLHFRKKKTQKITEDFRI